VGDHGDGYDHCHSPLVAFAISICTFPRFEAQRRAHSIIARLVGPVLGLLACAATAGVGIGFRQQPGHIFIPAAFLVVVTVVARIFGRAAGVLGTVTGALIFVPV
jgi:hypothetical protein